jgi:hypothetical protein
MLPYKIYRFHRNHIHFKFEAKLLDPHLKLKMVLKLGQVTQNKFLLNSDRVNY